MQNEKAGEGSVEETREEKFFTHHKSDITKACVTGFGAGIFSLLPLHVIGFPLAILTALLLVFGFTLIVVISLTVALYFSWLFSHGVQLVKFGTVGGLNTLLELTIVNALIIITGVATGVYFVAFKTTSFITASINAYFWNKHWTFKSESEVTIGEYGKFFLVNVVGLTINVGTASTLVNIVGAPEGVGDILWANMAVLIAVCSAVTWNFLSQKFIIFKK